MVSWVTWATLGVLAGLDLLISWCSGRVYADPCCAVPTPMITLLDKNNVFHDMLASPLSWLHMRRQ